MSNIMSGLPEELEARLKEIDEVSNYIVEQENWINNETRLNAINMNTLVWGIHELQSVVSNLSKSVVATIQEVYKVMRSQTPDVSLTATSSEGGAVSIGIDSKSPDGQNSIRKELVVAFDNESPVVTFSASGSNSLTMHNADYITSLQQWADATTSEVDGIRSRRGMNEAITTLQNTMPIDITASTELDDTYANKPVGTVAVLWNKEAVVLEDVAETTVEE